MNDELLSSMVKELQSSDRVQAMDNLVKAADYLNSAYSILEESGMTAQADKILNILAKIAQDENDAKKHPKRQPVKGDLDTGLTSAKMVENLKDHGTVFNLNDHNKADDLLNAEISEDDELVVGDDHDFEDE